LSEEALANAIWLIILIKSKRAFLRDDYLVQDTKDICGRDLSQLAEEAKLLSISPPLTEKGHPVLEYPFMIL
jgi:hypothetical protein